MRRFFVAILLFASCCRASTIIDYTGPESFDDFEWTFAGFSANTLVGIFDSDPGPAGPAAVHALVHDHAIGPITFRLELLLNGTWTGVGTFTTTGAFVGGVFVPYPLPDFRPELAFIDYGVETAFPGPLSFPQSVVSGVRLTSDPDIGYGYHFMDNVYLVFDDTTPIPEPAALSLTGFGLAGLLLGFRMRKQRSGIL